MASEKCGLIRPYIKKIGLDVAKRFVQLPSCNESDPLVQDH